MGKEQQKLMVNLMKHSEAIQPVVQFTPAILDKQVATSSREITKLKLVSVGGSAHVSVYDNANSEANPAELKWVLDSSLNVNDTDDFFNPLHFQRGVYMVCDDGFAFSPQVCITYIP